MDEDRLIARHPCLWHMAEDGKWPSIRQHGLLSTSALLDLYHVEDGRRAALLSEQRRRSVAIECPGLPTAILRDQKPIPPKALASCLEGDMAPAEWYRILNDRCFFWLSEKRLVAMLGAYGDRPHIVLLTDTASLVRSHRPRVELSRINSGFALRRAARRGGRTFLPIADYPHSGIAELAVAGGVPDIARHVIAVERRHRGRLVEALWTRKR